MVAAAASAVGTGSVAVPAGASAVDSAAGACVRLPLRYLPHISMPVLLPADVEDGFGHASLSHYFPNTGKDAAFRL